jgi:type I restriction enzyme M protein
MALRTSALIKKVWNYAHILRDDGLAFMEYTEQITYLLFLKIAWEQRNIGSSNIPSRYSWGHLRALSDNRRLLKRYDEAVRRLSKQSGLLGLIFTKPQSKINDPAKLRLLMQMIDSEDWVKMDVDIKGDVYEGLLARNAEDVRGGAGQYFTPRPVIRAVVEVMRPEPMMRIADPACGTGGFLLAAFDYLNKKGLKPKEAENVRTKVLHGTDLVPNVARLCAMNLFLHGIGTDHKHPLISIRDALEAPDKPVDMVLTNPPFGKKSSFTIIGKGGKSHSEKLSYQRDDFWATTSNKQLNFVQHVYSMLTDTGRAAVVVPDNVLFEGGAGETIRRRLLKQTDVHTLLRLPTGIWYSAGVKANVIFFDKKPRGARAMTQDTWVYDLRSNKNFSLRENPILSRDLTDFVRQFRAGNRDCRVETEHFRRFSYSEVVGRDKANLDIQWQLRPSKVRRDTSQTLMRDILNDLQTAMTEFEAAEKELEG